MTAALDNIKVIDLSRILAGPWASQMLADMGAQVIKVERPGKGDDTRLWGPPFISPDANKISAAKETSPATRAKNAAYFHCANRNKQSIAVDITKAQGQQLLKELIRQADVVIENYKVGGLKQYGLDYASLKALNPKLVYCSITGFGQNGPCAHKAGYDAMIQGEGGLMSLTGEPDGAPMKVGVALVDIATGLYSCNAILAALLARHTTSKGQGQYIDISLLDVQLAILANQGMNYLATGENPQRLGNGHPNIVPYQTFATQDGNLILAIGNDRQFDKFCRLAGCAELAQTSRFSSNAARVLNRKQLIPIIAQKLARHPTAWWVNELEQISVPCGAVNTLEQVVRHPQIKHRKMIKQVPDENGDLINTIASPINLSQTPLEYKSASPNLGQHTRQLLAQDLGYSQSKIDALFDAGIIC
ncbi:CaiB/BaiF CoA transferase family protein [Thalassomonas haliotis]|uniref:CoA transferase n=1 Tax=Thalassomonas haliotis TaxID=485448 RepID=A0ABY7VKH8_9GAMM|nr:CaiB/BaiF CoA-transferase family protein [Thalassomonas haliotis]WDE14255.1 CoA transferase [Thalassomonas haliotis]